MIKRLEKGYSSEELSFLIGKPSNYVSVIEDLNETEWCLEELNLLRIIFNCELKAFFKSYPESTLQAVAMRKTNNKKSRFYEAVKSSSEGVVELIFKLWEEFAEQPGPADIWQELEAIRTIVHNFIESGYFAERPKLACEILADGNQLTLKSIKPQHLQLILEEFLTTKQLHTSALTELKRSITYTQHSS